ncbi:MAG: Ig-like domain-containing protein, partial [Lachnospiraceae bacterium]|nr:Ig-like domain-containing protein [Lachnospiraceae bacterium]
MNRITKALRRVIAIVLVIAMSFTYSSPSYSNDAFLASENNEEILNGAGDTTEDEGEPDLGGEIVNNSEPIGFTTADDIILPLPTASLMGDTQNGYYKGSALLTLADDELPSELGITVYYEIGDQGRVAYTGAVLFDEAADFSVTVISVNDETETVSSPIMFTVKTEWAAFNLSNTSFSINQGGTVTVPFELMHMPSGIVSVSSSDVTELPNSAFSVDDQAGTITINVPVTTSYDSYTLTLTADDGAESISQTITLTVTESDYPIVNAETVFAVRYDDVLNYSFAAVSSDTYNLSLSYTILTPPTNGTASVTDGVLTYTPDALATSEQITVRVSNGSKTTDVTVQVLVFESPEVPALPYETTTDEDIVKTIDLSDFCDDPRGHALIYEIASQPANGQAVLSGSIITFTPDEDFFNVLDETEDIIINVKHAGNDFYTETITVKIAVVPVEDAPGANDDGPISVNTNGYLLIDVLDNDVSVDGDDLIIFQIETAPAKALSCYITNNKIYYKPNPRMNGTDIFTYSVIHEGGTLTDTAAVTITIDAVNDLQSIELADDTVTIFEDGQLMFHFFVHDIDSDDFANDFLVEFSSDNNDVFAAGTVYNLISVQADSDSRHYTVTCNPVAYANTTEHGSVNIEVKVTDITNDTLVATAYQNVIVTPVNNAPVISDYPNADVEINEDGSYTLKFRVTDPDITDPLNNFIVSVESDDTDVLTNAGIVKKSSTLINSRTVEYTYTLTPLLYRFNESGFDIIISAADGTGTGSESTQVTFTLVVKHVNHLPTANNDSYLNLLEDIAVTLNVLANDVDYDLHDDVDELLILSAGKNFNSISKIGETEAGGTVEIIDGGKNIRFTP